MPIQKINGPTISAGQSLSNAVDCSGGAVLRIMMPSAWSSITSVDPGTVTFQTSPDNTVFRDLYKSNGEEIQCFVTPGATVAFEHNIVIGWLKIRSGTGSRPVVQTQDRVFAVAIDTTP
jgi:hypothetical protein